jgi:hypothetical protein
MTEGKRQAVDGCLFLRAELLWRKVCWTAVVIVARGLLDCGLVKVTKYNVLPFDLRSSFGRVDRKKKYVPAVSWPRSVISKIHVFSVKREDVLVLRAKIESLAVRQLILPIFLFIQHLTGTRTELRASLY